jgi:predicted Fe-S protein YdhL (DUF1289 family)
MTRSLKFAAAVALALLVGAADVSARQRNTPQPRRKQQPAPDPKAPQGQNAQPGRNSPRNNRPVNVPRDARQQFNPGAPGEPAPFLERLRHMSPDDQQRFLRENRRFQQMPADRQSQIRENLRRWNALTPDQQQEVIRRDQVWQGMTPEHRRRVREEILPRWQQMEPPRRQAIMRRLNVLRPLSDDDRDAKLKDEAFLAGLSAEEREVLHTVAKLRLPPPGQPEAQPQVPPPDPDLPPLP